MHDALGQADTFVDTFERLREDEELYDASCLKIRTKAGELVPLDWNFAQRFVTEKLNAQLARDKRVRAIILKARQEGVSTKVAARFFRHANLWAGYKALIIANAVENAEAIFGIYERYHDNLPPELQPEITTKATRRSIAYAHDSELTIRPASDKNAGRASTIRDLHCSEIAFWPLGQQRETWVSATSAVPEYGSEIIVESTANGAGGLFYELWEKSQDPDSGWIGIFLPWWIHEEYDCTSEYPVTRPELELIAGAPDDFEKQALGEGIPWEGKNYVLPLSRLAWRRRKIISQFGGDPVTLGKDATRDFQQEFPATAEEAFIASGATYFDEDEVRNLARETRDPIRVGRFIETKDDDGTRQVVLQDAQRGFVRIWAEPEPVGHYTLGADTAEGKLVSTRRTLDPAANEAGGRDYSCASVVRFRRREEEGPRIELVATIHGQLASDILAKQITLAGEYFACGGPKDKPIPTRQDPIKVTVENNHSSGQRLLQYLKDILAYRNIYWQREYNTRTKQFQPRLGWRTDDKSRDVLLDSLGELIRKRQAAVPDADTVRELGQFVYNDVGKPGAIDGAHDDRVFGLALATWTALNEHRHAGTNMPRPFEAEDTGSGM
jgi:hypothetical protein